MSETAVPEAPSVEDRLADKLFGPAEEPEQAAEQDEPADDQVEEGEASEEATPAETVEAVEVEFDGWKGKIPSKLKAEIDKGADYTRKTQELAETRRLFESQVRLEQERQAFQQSASAELDQLRQIDAQLEQYRKVDLSSIDTDTLARMQMAAANLREDRAKLMEAVNAKSGDFKKRVYSAWDEMAQRAREAVKKTISDWDSASQKLGEYALNEGYPYEFVTGHDSKTKERIGPGIVDPVFAKTLYKAWKWDQLQANKPSATGKAAKAPPMVKPGAVDTRGAKQVEHMNFRKAIKNAKSDSMKADLIGERLSKRFNI